MRNYYLILGVPSDESEQGIRAAYRDRAKETHPDHAGEGKADAFRELQEAYEVLSDPGERRRHDAELEREARAERPRRRHRRTPASRSRGRTRPEPLVPEHPTGEPMSVFGNFATVRPSRDALRERVVRNFSGRRVPKGERARALTAEVELTPEQAARGTRVPLRVPVYHRCPACGGTGSVWMFPCHVCAAHGLVEDERRLEVAIPAGVRPGVVAEIPLEGLGIRNLYLRLVVRITRR